MKKFPVMKILIINIFYKKFQFKSEIETFNSNIRPPNDDFYLYFVMPLQSRMPWMNFLMCTLDYGSFMCNPTYNPQDIINKTTCPILMFSTNNYIFRRFELLFCINKAEIYLHNNVPGAPRYLEIWYLYSINFHR